MKITSEEQEILYQLRIQALEASHEAMTAVHKQKASQLDFENAMLKLYLKYGLGPKDRINEATGNIEKQEEDNGQESSNTDDERDG
jgi:hypothetical protein